MNVPFSAPRSFRRDKVTPPSGTQARGTLVTFAVTQEAKTFRRLAKELPDVKVLVTGMGGRNAARRLEQALAESSPGLVLTCGFAGGLDPMLAEGTIVISASPDANEISARMLANGARLARFHCGETIVSTSKEKEVLRRTTGADAVEMESGIIAGLCLSRGIPCVVVRVVLDTAAEDLPLDFNMFLDADSRLRVGRVALAALAKPSVLRGLLQLNRRSAAAASKLAETLMLCLRPAASRRT